MRRSAGLVPAVILVGAAVAGCGPQAGPPAASPTTTAASASPTPSATSSPTETASPAPATTTRGSLKTFTTADGQLAFDLPATWSVRDPAGELPEGGGAFAEVTNEAGRPMATLRTNMATGSTCLEKYPYEVLESQELPALAQDGETPRFIYETRGNTATPGPADTPAAAYGIVSVPAPRGTWPARCSTSSPGLPPPQCSVRSTTRRTTGPRAPSPFPTWNRPGGTWTPPSTRTSAG
ncbi:hypothetical protein [Arthrobacter sp. SD76]|uniref:hypothetical protein n=1 Tax=Arthrobacter sp. SD76 TaxID=3415007 RepID=UPI003C73FBC4